jgi:hypothetical protein
LEERLILIVAQTLMTTSNSRNHKAHRLFGPHPASTEPISAMDRCARRCAGSNLASVSGP